MLNLKEAVHQLERAWLNNLARSPYLCDNLYYVVREACGLRRGSLLVGQEWEALRISNEIKRQLEGHETVSAKLGLGTWTWQYDESPEVVEAIIKERKRIIAHLHEWAANHEGYPYPIRPRLAVFDETWALSDKAKEECGKYWGIYVYDALEHTYCCELRPSHYMICVGFETEKRISDDLHGDLQTYLVESNHYRHPDAIPYSMDMGKFDSMEEAEEHARCNPPWLSLTWSLK